MTEIQHLLAEAADQTYADFQAKLTPNIPRSRFLGVRVPAARNLAKTLYRSGTYKDFLTALPHETYDENILHSLLLSEIRDYEECLAAVEAFLPYVDNWAVCDILAPKCFRRHRDELLTKIRSWTASAEEYTIRFGLEMLMAHYLDEDFSPAYLEIPADVQSDKYYVNMMIAWFYATALAKQWDAAIGYIESRRLSPWVHNKTIQKARESYRITAAQKEYLKKWKLTGKK